MLPLLVFPILPKFVSTPAQAFLQLADHLLGRGILPVDQSIGLADADSAFPRKFLGTPTSLNKLNNQVVTPFAMGAVFMSAEVQDIFRVEFLRRSAQKLG